MFSSGSTPPLPTIPGAPPPPPMFGSQANKAAGQKQKPAKSPTPTFLGESPSNTGQKTLIGQ